MKKSFVQMGTFSPYTLFCPRSLAHPLCRTCIPVRNVEELQFSDPPHNVPLATQPSVARPALTTCCITPLMSPNQDFSPVSLEHKFEACSRGQQQGTGVLTNNGKCSKRCQTNIVVCRRPLHLQNTMTRMLRMLLLFTTDCCQPSRQY